MTARTILIDRTGTKQDVLSGQEAMLRLAERNHGLTARRLSAETGVPLSTVQSWRRALAPGVMSLADFVAVSRVIPNYLTSLCVEPAGKSVVDLGDNEGDLDALAEDAEELAHGYARARHPNSPGGTAIVPQEAAPLHLVAKRMCGKAKVA